MKLSPIVFFTLIFIPVSWGTFAQSQANFVVRKADIKKLPPQAHFNSLQQDKDGFLWIGTISGLYRYDGSVVNRFVRDPYDTNSLSHNYISTLANDKAGNLWIGTFGSFTNKFDRITGKIERIEPTTNTQNRSVTKKIKSSWDGENMVIATSQWLFKISLSGVVRDSFHFSLGQDQKNAVITDFSEYSGDRFIICSSSGVYMLDWKKRQLDKLQLSKQEKKFNCIEKDSDGNFWIGSDTGLSIINAENFGLRDLTKYDTGLLLTNSYVKVLKKDKAGRMWIGTNAGLLLAENGNVTRIKEMEGQPTLNNILDLLIDSKGSTWVATEDNGLYQVFQPSIIFKTIPGIKAYSGKHIILSILEEKPGNWLIGTMAGVYRYIFSSGTFEEIYLDAAKNKMPVNAQFIDRHSGHWVGTVANGVFYRKASESTFIQFQNEPGNDNSLPFNRIGSFTEDEYGNIWMGVYNSSGSSNSLCYFDPRTQKINRITSDILSPGSFHSFAISQVEADDQHHLWIGTLDAGMHRFHITSNPPPQNTFTNFTDTSVGQHKISHLVVTCVRPGRKGKIWFGTVSGGLNVLDTRSDSISWFTIKNGLAGNLVYRIEEDDQGILWLSTDNGISRFDPSSKSIINYNTSSGLPTNNFAFWASMKCKDGSIAYGTNDGQVVYFNPNSYKNSLNTQPVVITDIRLFNKSLVTGNASALEKVAYLTDTIRLDHAQSVISFELSNMDFLNPEIYTYAYQLQGFDKDWTYISDRTSITYTNLDPGTYSLLIKNANHLGIWNETPTKMVVIIKPPFWQTWWFTLLLAMVIAAIIYALFRYRLQQKLQVLQVRNRLHRDLHDDIGATLSSVKVYSEILKDEPHNPVIAELIRDNSTEMLERLEVIAWATDPHHDNYRSLKNRMIKFVAPLCDSKNIAYVFASKDMNEEMLMHGEIRQNIYLVFKESINNMIKYAEATSCDIRVFVRSKLFTLQINDNGKGFDGTTEGTGTGWKNMQKRAESLNGKLIIESLPGKGTTIIMHLPYPFKIPNSWDGKR